MRSLNTPVMLVLDSVNIQYATGARNMKIFSTRTPSRYLLMFAQGPAILYEYFGCEHLARELETIDDVRPARGLCYVSSGGDPIGQATALAAEITAAVRDAGLSIDGLAVDRFPYSCIDAFRAEGFALSDADSIFSAARKTKLPGEIALLRESKWKRVSSQDAVKQKSGRISAGLSWQQEVTMYPPGCCRAAREPFLISRKRGHAR